MCDLFAMSCNDEDRATRSLPIFSEYASRNPDGWGIGWFEGNNAVVHRAACRADWDDAFFDSIDEAPQSQSNRSYSLCYAGRAE